MLRRYILRRFAQGLLTIFAVSIVIFLLSHISGDPVELLLPIEATQQDRMLLRQKWGLDRPLPVQYVIFIGSALRGDLGVSYLGARKVTELIGQRLPNTVKLCAVAVAIALVAGLVLGVTSAVKRGTAIDFGARLVAVFGQSLPSFLKALIFMELFAVWLGWVPSSGMGGFRHYILPAVTLSWVTTAGILRLLRSSMLEVMDSEYIKLARIKGVSEPLVIWKHIVRNALIPVVTFAGMQFAILITAAVVVETIFAWPGIGQLAYQAIMERDFPVIRGVILTVVTIVILVNLLVDFIYAYLDPRIRYR